MTATLPVIGAGTLAEAMQVAGGPALAALEEHALPGFVGRQRWFSAKARTIDRIRLAAHGPLPHVGPAASDGAARWLLLGDVIFADGAGDRYVLPLVELPSPAAAAVLNRAPGAAVAWVDAPGGRLLADGMLDDEICRALLAVVRGGATLPLTTGTLAGTHLDGPGLDAADPPSSLPVRRTGAEQSNSSVIFGSEAIFKLFRRIEPGPHPEIEMGCHLARGGFRAAPAVLGVLEYSPTDEPVSSAVGVLHALVANEGDGWAHALREVGHYFGRLAQHPLFPVIEGGERPGGYPPELGRALVGSYLDAAATLGRQTAEMHLALARPFGDAAFAPEQLTAEDVSRVVEGARARASRALAQLAARRDRLSPEALARASTLIGRQPDLFGRLDALAAMRIGGARTRVHQDYHLGQTLWTGREYVILDFEGEPLRPLADRRVKRSPLTDVAGMLRSYSYAAWSGLFAWAGSLGRDASNDEFWATLWEREVSNRFLHSYLEGVGDAEFIPRDEAEFDAWLRGLMLEKAVYELEYELNNRPDWVLVPVEGLLRLIE